MYRLFFWISKLYTLLIKGQFGHFGRGSVIKPFLNIANPKFIYIGRGVDIGSFCWISVSTEFGGHRCKSKRKIRLKIGNNTDIGNNAFIVANNDIKIGDHVILAPYVFISDHSHTFYDIKKNLHNQPLTEGGKVKIGDNVFIGIKASILPNVTIGEHVVIGANTVVSEDIPAYSVAVGNPAKIVKKYSFSKKKWMKI